MKVKIKDYIYEIVEVEEFDERLKCGDGNYAFGITRYKEQDILIARQLTSKRKRETLIHELTHAFVEIFGFYTHKDKFSDEDVCEFVSKYCEDILKIVNDYFMEVIKW